MRLTTVAQPSSNDQLVRSNPTTLNGTSITIDFANVLNESLSAAGLVSGRSAIYVTSIGFEVTATYVNDTLLPYTLRSSLDLLLSLFGRGIKWNYLDSAMGDGTRIGPQEMPGLALILREMHLKGENFCQPIVLEVDGVKQLGRGTGAPDLDTYTSGLPETFMADASRLGGLDITFAPGVPKVVKYFWEYRLYDPMFVATEKNLGTIHRDVLSKHQMTFTSASLGDDGDRPLGPVGDPMYLRLSEQSLNVWVRHKTAPASKESLYPRNRDENWQLANQERTMQVPLEGGALIHAWYLMRDYANLGDLSSDQAARVPVFSHIRSFLHFGVPGLAVPNLWDVFDRLQIPLAGLPIDDLKLEFREQAIMHLQRLPLRHPLRYLGSSGFLVPIVYPEMAGLKKDLLATDYLRIDFSVLGRSLDQYDHMVWHGEMGQKAEASTLGISPKSMSELPTAGIIPGQMNPRPSASSNPAKNLFGAKLLRAKPVQMKASVAAPPEAKVHPKQRPGARRFGKMGEDY